MATNGGPNMSRKDLSFFADFNNSKSIQKDKNILSISTWRVGSGNTVVGYSTNGLPSENFREVKADPFGNNCVIWECRPSGDSNGDGGWNSSRFNVDSSKLYRLSVWMNLFVSGNTGQAYLGSGGYDAMGSNIGLINRESGSVDLNPYSWISSPSSPLHVLRANTWTLIVSHIFPVGSGIGLKHYDSGRYTIQDGRVGDVLRDYIWQTGTTQSNHRSYFYYSLTNIPVLRFSYPRFEVCDGTEPSIEQLLLNEPKKINNLMNSSDSGFLINGAELSNPPDKGVYFDGVDDRIIHKELVHVTSGMTYDFWVNKKSNVVGNNMIWGGQVLSRPFLSFGSSGFVFFWKYKLGGLNIDGTLSSIGSFSVNKWYNVVCTLKYDLSLGKSTALMYINGVLNNSASYDLDSFSDTYIKLVVGDYDDSIVSPFNGNISQYKIYNRILPLREIETNYKNNKLKYK